jgi:tripartite-type tricarboxylate transporter receptor subunit TctC
VPKPILAKLNADLVKVLSMPDTRRRLAEHGIDVAPTTTEQFAEFTKFVIVRSAKVVKEAGITPG